MKPAFQLPFKCGQTWRASTYDGHYPDQDSLDFVRRDGSKNISADEDVLASAAGTVVEAHDTNADDPPYGSVVSIQHEGDWRTQYIHLDDKLAVKLGDKVTRGQKIGVVGGEIAIFGKKDAHLHYTQWQGESGVRCTFNGVDAKVHADAKDSKGNYPTEDVVSANCPTPPFGRFVSAVSRDSRSLDVFAIGRDGRFLAAAWEHIVLDGQWRGWWHVRSGKVPRNAAISSVSRDENKLDVFVAGSSGTVFTAAWDRNVKGSEWRGWWPIGGLTAAPGAPVNAVSRDRHKLDVFAVGKDGHVYTAAWDQHVSQGKWRGWWKIGDLKVPSGGTITAVSRDTNKLDVFAVGANGRVYTAAWDQHVASGKWRGWWNIQGAKNCPPGGPVSVVSRDSNKLDVFVVGNNGRVYTAAWDQHVASAKWRGWWNVQEAKNCPPGALVSVVARDKHKLDVFVVGNDGRVYSAAWDQHVAGGKWRGWWNIQEAKNCPPGAPVAVASRDPQKLDAFVIGKGGTVFTAAWDQKVAAGKWRGWWEITP